MVALTDLTGKKFGKLKVIKRGESSPKGSVRWNCQCDCGKTTTVFACALKSGNTKSCGCIRIQTSKENKSNVKHGMSNTKTYKAWMAMIGRCNNPSYKSYKDYGARGIYIDSRWLSFECFLSDMGVAPEGYSIDRIDNNGNYEPGNCRWTDVKTQARNRRSNHLIKTKYGELCIAELAEMVCISRKVLRNRIVNLGWSIDEALSVPVNGKR